MDQHPIPQDVTGFQFKLIGTMTVKQFGYVATGVIMAVVLFYLPIHSVFGVLLKVILIPLFGSSGIVIAFVPIDGRPIDVMTTNFIKAVFAPNQYVYHRQGRQLSFTMIPTTKTTVAKKTQQKTQTTSTPVTPSTTLDRKEEKLRALLLSSRGRVKNDIDKKEAAFLQTLTLPTTAPQTTTVASPQIKTTPVVQTQPVAPIASVPQIPPQAVQQAPVIPQTPPVVNTSTPSPVVQKSMLPQPPAPTNPTNNPDDLSKKELDLEKQLTQAKQEELISKTPVVEQQKIALLSQQIEEVHAKKQQLEQELSQLKNQLATQKGTPPPPAAAPQPQQEQQHVRVIPQGVTKKAGLPHVSDSPNVVVGIVKDPRGNILPRILVEVKDKDGNPVRAFKTNQLGQFASATPLSPGTYTIELEDPKKQQQFDIVQITANNQILLPIEIISHDAREELRKQLFAN